MYSHSGATLSKMLECLVNFIAKCKLSEFAIGFCHSKKMYNGTIYFSDRTNVRSKLLLLGHLPNLVGHCPMSDSNLQPNLVPRLFPPARRVVERAWVRGCLQPCMQIMDIGGFQY